MSTEDGYHAQLFARMVGEVDHWLAVVYLIDDQGRYEFVALTPLRSSTRGKALTLACMLAERHRDARRPVWGEVQGGPIPLDLRDRATPDG